MKGGGGWGLECAVINQWLGPAPRTGYRPSPSRQARLLAASARWELGGEPQRLGTGAQGAPPDLSPLWRPNLRMPGLYEVLERRGLH